jgi:hypothetical protein
MVAVAAAMSQGCNQKYLASKDFANPFDLRLRDLSFHRRIRNRIRKSQP